MQYVVSLLLLLLLLLLLFASLGYFLITRLVYYNILFMFCSLLCIFVLCFVNFVILYCFCTVLCIVSPSVHSCLLPIFVQVYRPLPSGGNPVAVNIYYTSYHITEGLNWLMFGKKDYPL